METDNSVTKISEDERVVGRQFLYGYTFLIIEYGLEYFAI